jgi:hypothetical protein
LAQPKHSEFVEALQKLIKEFAHEFEGSSPEAKERAAHRYAATRLTNSSDHRRGTKRKSPIGQRCAKCGEIIESDGEFHHPDPVEQPRRVEPVHRACHSGGAFEKR